MRWPVFHPYPSAARLFELENLTVENGIYNVMKDFSISNKVEIIIRWHIPTDSLKNESTSFVNFDVIIRHDFPFPHRL